MFQPSTNSTKKDCQRGISPSTIKEDGPEDCHKTKKEEPTDRKVGKEVKVHKGV